MILSLPYCSFLRWKRFYVKFKKKNIKGFLINGKEIKTTLFTDDMTCFLRGTNSYFQLLTSLQNFARYSGLRVNDEKTEIFAIGPHSLVQDVFTHKIHCMIKILGVYFIYDTPTRLKTNYESIFKSIQGTLNSWNGRGLALIGKIQIAKSFIIPTFLRKVALISVPEDHVKEINKLNYHFIWKGNDKIKRSAVINDINDGGLKIMLDIHSMICAQRVMV